MHGIEVITLHRCNPQVTVKSFLLHGLTNISSSMIVTELGMAELMMIHRDVKPGNIMMVISASRADGSVGPATQRNLKHGGSSGRLPSFMGTAVGSISGSFKTLKSSSSVLDSNTPAVIIPGDTSKAGPLDSQKGQILSTATVSGNLEFGKRRRAGIGYNNTGAQTGQGQGQFSYKLIDLGTAVAVHDVEDFADSESLRTVTELEFAG